MVLSWITRSKQPRSVDDLVSRGKYHKALEVMREEFAVRYPSAPERLRFADVLVLAGQEKEALPVLLGVVDEQERYGFKDRALEALRRAEEIAPRDPEVVERLELIQGDRSAPEPAEEENDRPAELGNLEDAINTAFASSVSEPEASAEAPAPEDAAAAPQTPVADDSPEANGGLKLDEDELTLSEEDLEPFDAEEDQRSDARALLRSRDAAPTENARSLVTEEELEEEAHELLSGKGPEPGAQRILLTEEELEEDIQADARALLAEEDPDTDEFRPLITEDDLENEIQADARALLGTEEGAEASSDAPATNEALPARGPKNLTEREEDELHGFVLAIGQWPGSGRAALGRILFAQLSREELRRVADGLHPHAYTPGDLIVREGDIGSSIFLIASGCVQIFVTAGRNQPFEIRRMESGDFFGEVAALAGHPRTATVVATTHCELLEIDREALDTLVSLRPNARALLDEAVVNRMQSPEEQAVRALLPGTVDPDRAARALKEHFGETEWSPKVRLHLARLMLDVGRDDDALAILASVAEDLARRGQAQRAISVLKKVERIQRRGIQEVCLAPLKGHRRKAARRARAEAEGHTPPQAVKEAAFREWVGSVLRETADLAHRTTGSVEEEAEGAGQGQGHQVPGQPIKVRVHGLRRRPGGHKRRHEHAG